MTNKKWSDLYSAKQGKLEFWSAAGGQSAFVLTEVEAKLGAINAIAQRPQRDGRDNFVAALPDTELNYFAPAGAVMGIENGEFVFSVADTAGGAIYVAPDKSAARPVQVFGARVQSSGYFRLLLDDPEARIGEPFTAVELEMDVNTTIDEDDNPVYPPGAYIFRLDGSSAFGFDMQPSYKTNSVTGKLLVQPSGHPSIHFELLSVPESPLYVAWYRNDGSLISVVNCEDDTDVRNTTDGLELQELVTSERLRGILMNIFASDTDPTEGIPWKLEEWEKTAPAKRPFDLSQARVAEVNDAPRIAKNGLTNYAGQLLGPTKKGGVGIGYYADPGVTLLTDKRSLSVKMKPTALADVTFSLIPEGDEGGFREIELAATVYFSFTAYLNNKTEQIGKHRVMKVTDLSSSNTIHLVKGVNTDGERIYPPGQYVIRTYDLCGATITLKASVQLAPDAQRIQSPGMDGAYDLSITEITDAVGSERYAVWYKDEEHLKIANLTDPNDIKISLDGMYQIEPVIQRDVADIYNELYSNYSNTDEMNAAIQKAVAGGAAKPDLWKLENWIGYNLTNSPITLPAAFQGKDTLTFPYASIAPNVMVAVESFSADPKFFTQAGSGIAYKEHFDAGATGGADVLMLPSAAPYFRKLSVTLSHQWSMNFIKVPVNLQSPQLDTASDTDVGIVDSNGKNVPLGDVYPAGAYDIFFRTPYGVRLNCANANNPADRPAAADVSIAINGIGVGNNYEIFSVVYDVTGKIVRISSTKDPNVTRDNLNGLIKIPTFVEEEIATEPDADPIKLINDLRLVIDRVERDTGFEKVNGSGVLNIDWTTGKFKKQITLMGDLVINFAKPPPFPTIVELMVLQSRKSNNTGNSFKATLNTPPPMAVTKDIAPTSTEGRWIQAYYDGTQYLVNRSNF